jgi:hypothetical protein
VCWIDFDDCILLLRYWGVWGALRDDDLATFFHVFMRLYNMQRGKKERKKKEKRGKKRKEGRIPNFLYILVPFTQFVISTATRLILSTSILPIIMAKKDRSVSVSPHKGTKQKNV